MQKEISATIITIGNELLIGQVVDTNSAFMSKVLNKTGVVVKRKIAIADNMAEIKKALDAEINQVQIILITGGLGPTSDDVTKQTLCTYFKSEMVVNKRALQHVKNLYEKVYKKSLNPVNLKQAEVPAACKVILNKRGSAPCMQFEKGRSMIFSLPGVPYEMEGLMPDIIGVIRQRFQLPKVIHHTLVTSGIGESELAAILKDFEKEIGPKAELAYLPGLGVLRLRLSATVMGREEEDRLRRQFQKLKKLAGDYLISTDDTPVEEIIGKMLNKKKKTIATAESCTGGFIASMITSVSGASDYFPGSVVSYSNNIKMTVLGVKASTLKKHGAVSEEVVREMLKGIVKRMKSDYGVAVSGIMGPGGGSAQKPVGTVWVAVGSARKVVTKKFHFRFDRRRNIQSTAIRALYLLKSFLEEA
ncbi:MAG: CinA family nicotinamide mononucleotide deamidase-related protein [Chitinophagaceae bacterium]|nr:CinA family nicotinamide mononucleotide deamidase-related protein [Chitinophagaceae bacterium]